MTAGVAYNDCDRSACEWLRQLASDGAISDGTIIEGSIHDLQPAHLVGFTRVHLFAGIGGWELALQLAGWPESVPVWTGSCPCQPFSTAGMGLGTADHRHLWPEMLRLVRECRPPVVFGEQVASAAGRAWCAGVRADMEALGYAFGAADLCAAGVGAPHIRQRLYWVATRVGHAHGTGSQGHGEASMHVPGELPSWSPGHLVGCTDGAQRRIGVEPSVHPLADGVPGRVGLLRGYGNAIVPPLAAVFVRSVMDSIDRAALASIENGA